MAEPITTTIDSGGRVVVPKQIRDRLGLRAGREIEVRERDGVIELVPQALPVEFADGPHGLVAVTGEEIPPLTAAQVRETLESARR